MSAEALLSDTDWTYEDELELLKEEITQIADQLRADETKKMLILLEVSGTILSSHPLTYSVGPAFYQEANRRTDRDCSQQTVCDHVGHHPHYVWRAPQCRCFGVPRESEE